MPREPLERLVCGHHDTTKPEMRITLDSTWCQVGSLTGQPEGAGGDPRYQNLHLTMHYEMCERIPVGPVQVSSIRILDIASFDLKRPSQVLFDIRRRQREDPSEAKRDQDQYGTNGQQHDRPTASG